MGEVKYEFRIEFRIEPAAQELAWPEPEPVRQKSSAAIEYRKPESSTDLYFDSEEVNAQFPEAETSTLVQRDAADTTWTLAEDVEAGDVVCLGEDGKLRKVAGLAKTKAHTPEQVRAYNRDMVAHCTFGDAANSRCVRALAGRRACLFRSDRRCRASSRGD